MFYLYYISGNIFKEIHYSSSNNLIEILNKILEEYSYSYYYIQLILNNNIINIGNKENNFNYYIINNLKTEITEQDFIQILFIEKTKLFCLE